MSFNGAGYFKGKLPPLLFVEYERPSWEMPCRFLLGLFQNPGGYGIPREYHHDLDVVRATFFPSLTVMIVDMLVSAWVSSKNDHERKTMSNVVPFQALPHFQRGKLGAGPVTGVYHLQVRFHNTYTLLFTAMDAIAYIFSIADPPPGVALTPDLFFLPLLREFARFLYFMQPNQDMCPKVMCIVMLVSGDKIQWLLGASIGRFKTDDRCWDSELKSGVAEARWIQTSKLLGLDSKMQAPVAGSVGGQDWGYCAESLPYACFLRRLDSRPRIMWSAAVKLEGKPPVQWGSSVALERAEVVTIPPCHNCQRLLELMNVENYSKSHPCQTFNIWRGRHL